MAWGQKGIFYSWREAAEINLMSQVAQTQQRTLSA